LPLALCAYDAVVVNEAAAMAFRTDDPIDKELTSLDIREEGRSYKIIGVMRDFNYESLHTQVRPLVLHLNAPRQAANILTARLSSEEMRTTIGYIEKTWKKFAPEDEVIRYRFTDETLARLYDSEEKTNKVSTIFSSLAIFIACLGLFGLAAFVTEQRTKEIGIRKVLGASITEIVILLSREFAVWVLIANLIAWPVAYYVMKNWLQNFAFRVEMSWLVFIASGLGTLLVALFTVALHVVKTARANPVESLKYE
jgi:putative ABC transport system permease protein